MELLNCNEIDLVDKVLSYLKIVVTKKIINGMDDDAVNVGLSEHSFTTKDFDTNVIRLALRCTECEGCNKKFIISYDSVDGNENIQKMLPADVEIYFNEEDNVKIYYEYANIDPRENPNISCLQNVNLIHSKEAQ